MPGMSYEQKLYPHYIYRINQSLQEIKEVCGIQQKLISLSFVNFLNRKFSRLVVNDKRWDFDNDICQNILKFTDQETKWSSFIEKFNNNGIDTVSESIKFFKEAKSHRVVTKEERERCHFHFINLFQSYTVNDNKYIDGIIFRKLKEADTVLKYALGELLFDRTETYKIYPWLLMDFYFEGKEMISSCSCQEHEKDIDLDNRIINENEMIEISKTEYSLSDEDIVYLHYFIPLFAAYKNRKTGEDFKGEHLLDPTKRNTISKFKYLLFIPVYDAVIDGNPSGNLIGNISIPFDNVDDRKIFCYEKLETMQKQLPKLLK